MSSYVIPTRTRIQRSPRTSNCLFFIPKNQIVTCDTSYDVDKVEMDLIYIAGNLTSFGHLMKPLPGNPARPEVIIFGILLSAIWTPSMDDAAHSGCHEIQLRQGLFYECKQIHWQKGHPSWAFH